MNYVAMDKSPWIPLLEIRREQKRVAALMRKSVNIEIPKVKRKPLSVSRTYCVCSKLDPQGKYRNPALDYLQQGLQNVRSNNIGVLDYLQKRTTRETSSKSHISLKGWKSTSDLRDDDSRILKQPQNYESEKYGGVVKKDDIERFSYCNLQKQSVKFPRIVPRNTSETGVPHNTPAGTQIAMKPNRKRLKRSRSSSLSSARVPRGRKEKQGSVKGQTYSGRDEQVSVSHTQTRRGTKHAGQDRVVSSVDIGASTTQSVYAVTPETGSSQHAVMNGGKIAGDDPHIAYIHSAQGYCDCMEPALQPETDDMTEDNPHNLSSEENEPLLQNTRCLRCGRMVNRKYNHKGSNATGESGFRGESEMSEYSSVSAASLTRHQVTTDGLSSGVSKIPDILPDIKPLLSRENTSYQATVVENSGPANRRNVSGFDKFRPSIGEDIHQRKGARPKDGLKSLDEKLQQGKLDFSNDVDIYNVDTRLRISGGKEREQKKAKKKSKASKSTLDPLVLYPGGYKEAYLKALGASRASQIYSEAWLLNQRISGPTFSYFDPGADHPCRDYRFNAPLPSHKIMATVKARTGKKYNEMRHIFGKLNINDFYPGGKRNLRPIDVVTED